jgi:hypothetical protein
MKKILVAIALSGAMAAPVYAKTVKPLVAATQDARADDGRDYVGHDPDPRIQSELLRDRPSDRL